jgi:hypothetical protein
MSGGSNRGMAFTRGRVGMAERQRQPQGVVVLSRNGLSLPVGVDVLGSGRKIASRVVAAGSRELRGCRETNREAGVGRGPLQKSLNVRFTIYSGSSEFPYFGAARSSRLLAAQTPRQSKTLLPAVCRVSLLRFGWGWNDRRDDIEMDVGRCPDGCLPPLRGRVCREFGAARSGESDPDLSWTPLSSCDAATYRMPQRDLINIV